MGISLELWRVRIGSFSNSGCKVKRSSQGYAIPTGALHAVRFLVLFTLFNVLVCTAAHPCRVDLDSSNTVSEHISNTFRPHGTMSIDCDTFCNGEHLSRVTDCTPSEGNLHCSTNNLWQTSVHSKATITCAGDIEMNPGPGQDNEPQHWRLK